MTRVFIETYGCQMNVADSELMAGVLQRAGMTLVERAEDADAVILNTCAIRENAEQRVLGRLGDYAHLKAANPALIVGVAGCMAQHLRAKLLEKKRVLDLVVGPDGYRALPELLRRAAGEPVAEVRLDRDETYGDLEPKRDAGVRAWVTVQRGCDKFCTYCVVPFTRGRERSLPLADLVRQMEQAAAAGFREIVLLGQTVNSWRHGEHDFADLLRAANGVEGVLRVRFTSPHPADMTDRVIEAVATCERVMPHVHLPLQSGSDRILTAMNRTYTRAQFMDCAAKLRAAIPGVALSTDIIVGFPGETEADYQETLATYREARFDSGFLFKYSARPDTKAHRWPETVSEEEKGRRLSELIDVQMGLSAEINDGWLGREVEVLVENPSRREPPQLYGKSREFKTVVFGDDGSAPGTLQRVRVIGATAITLIGESLQVPRPEPLVSIGG
jgi:tRNA-2-methylthio-N6-dimethylallyladenosine synthase